MKKIKISILLFAIIWGFSENTAAQTILNADGPGNTYELINSILAPNGGDVVESAECVHPEFGRHITEVWDTSLNQYVFAFHIHVTPDNDRCINFDRQRVEIKTYDTSPANLKGVAGETVTYKWKFYVPVGYQPSSSFTHLHQIKAVGGDDSDPLFVLTARKGTPNKMELNYYIDSNLSSEKLTSVNLSLFEGNWVEVTERVKISNTGGTYSIIIKNISTGATVLSYSNNNLLTIRADNNFIRPKWGIYRSLLNAQALRDEIVLFNGFSIHEEQNTATFNPADQGDNYLSVQQNNVSKQVDIEYNNSGLENTKIQIINTKGQVLNSIIPEQQKGIQKLSLDLSHLNNNIYFARLISHNNTNTVKFILSQH